MHLILLTGITYSQSIYKTVTYQLDGAASDSIRFDKGITLSGLLWPTSISDSISIDVSRGDGNWFRLTDNDGVEITQIALTSKANAIPLKPIYFYPWTYYRFVITDVDTAGNLPFTATAVGVPYLGKDK